VGWLLLRFGAPFLDGGVLGFFPRLILPLLLTRRHHHLDGAKQLFGQNNFGQKQASRIWSTPCY
jgi:hypothetical protein